MHCMISVQTYYPDQMPITLDAQIEIDFRIYDRSTDPRHQKICVSRSLIQELWVSIAPYVFWTRAAVPCSARPEQFRPISLMHACSFEFIYDM